jgi:GTPase involved in cell partitioning and DNA repair
MFETGVERILQQYQGTCVSSIFDDFPSNITWSVPIIVVFTKLDILREKEEVKLERELQQRDEELDDEEFDAKVDAAVDKGVQELCVKPLQALSPDYRWITTSSGSTSRVLNPTS